MNPMAENEEFYRLIFRLLEKSRFGHITQITVFIISIFIAIQLAL